MALWQERAAAVKPVQDTAVEVCPDCDIAGCTHIRNRTGAFASTGNTEERTVYMNGHKASVANSMTGARMKSMFGIPADYQIFCEDNPDDRPVNDADKWTMKDGMQFYSLPPATSGSGASPSSPLSEEKLKEVMVKSLANYKLHQGRFCYKAADIVYAAIAPHLSDTSAYCKAILLSATSEEIYELEWERDGVTDKPAILQIRDNLNEWADKARDLMDGGASAEKARVKGLVEAAKEAVAHWKFEPSAPGHEGETFIAGPQVIVDLSEAIDAFEKGAPNDQ